MNINISKTGVLTTQIVEPYITLSDGSKWQLLLFHLVDNGNRLFTSTNCGYCNDYGLYSRLQWIDDFQYNNKYEFYVIQDNIEHRWSQTNAPLTTTSITDFVSIQGTPGGGICKCSGNTCLAATNTTSNWWRACGCYHIYNGGIPGFNNKICKDYLALYVRVEKPKVFFEKNNISQGENFYEY